MFIVNNFFWWWLNCMKNWKPWGLRIVVSIFWSILYKWILLILASEWWKNVIRKNFLANESICINFRYLFDCISVDERHNRKKSETKAFFTIVFKMCSWKVLVLDENNNCERHWNRFRICRRLTRKGKKLDMNFRRIKCIIVVVVVVVVIQLLTIWRSFFPSAPPCFALLRLNMSWIELAMFSINIFFRPKF